MNQLIRCINCDAVFMSTPFDQIPEYELDASNPFETIKSYERNDFQDFLTHHQGHQLEELKIIEDSFISEKDYFEPVKVSYIKATNGKEKFVIKKFREKIDEPLRYELIHGDYQLKCISFEIQEDEIRKELKKEFNDYPISQNKIDKFIKLFRHIAKNVDLKNLERVDEESNNPLKVFYKIDDLNLAYLLRNCRNIFNKEEFPKIESFIYSNKDDGVLLLQANFQIQLKISPKRNSVISEAVSEEKIAIKKK